MHTAVYDPDNRLQGDIMLDKDTAQHHAPWLSFKKPTVSFWQLNKIE